MAQQWIVDGNNVVGSRPDGWWRDRPAASARLVDSVSNRSWPEAASMTIVFDGANGPGAPDGSGVGVFYSGPGRSADDAIVERVGQLRVDGLRALVVTSDRALGDRVRQLGADVMPSGRFLALLEDRS